MSALYVTQKPDKIVAVLIDLHRASSNAEETISLDASNFFQRALMGRDAGFNIVNQSEN